MPDKNARVPSLCRHRATGQAVVRLNGRDFYLGSFNSAAAKAEYNRRIAEWLASGRQLPNDDAAFSVAELIVAFVRHAGSYYVKAGVRTSEYEVIRQAATGVRKERRAVS